MEKPRVISGDLPGHASPAYYYRDDEIDLKQLIQQLFSQRFLIAAITAVGTLAAIAVALMLPRVYEVKAIVGLPKAEQIEPLNRNGIKVFSAEEIYGEYFENLLSIDLMRDYFKQQAFYNVVSPPEAGETRSPEDIDRIFAKFRESFKIQKIRPDYMELGKDEKTPLNKVSISLETGVPEETAQFINGYLDYVQEQTRLELAEEQAATKRVEQETLQKQIQALTEQARADREARIARLTESNNTKIATLEDQIKTLVEQALFEREARIAKLQEALRIAKTLGIQEPRSLDDFRNPVPETAAGSQIAINTNLKGEDRPLYLMGSKFLAAEIEQLKNRRNDEYFVPKLGDLRRELALAKNNREIEALKNRENDTLFVEQLPEIERKLAALELASLEFGNASFFQWEQPAFVPQAPVKPKKALIVAIAFALSAMLGVMIALLRGILQSPSAAEIFRPETTTEQEARPQHDMFPLPATAVQMDQGRKLKTGS